MARQRRLNKNVVAFLTIMAILLTVVVVAIATYQGSRRDPEVYAGTARGLEQAGDRERAIEQYLKAYNVRKEVKYLIEASRCAYEIGEIGQALNQLRVANTQRPDDVTVLTAYLERLEHLAEMGAPQWLDMRDYSKKMLELDPNNALGLLMRAVALRQLADESPENPQQAREALQRVTDIAPQDPRVALFKAQEELRQIAELQRAAKGQPLAPDAAAEAEQHRTASVNILKAGLEANPNYPRVVLVYAQMLQEAGQLDDSVAVLQQAATAHPENAELAHALGRAVLFGLAQKRDQLAPEAIDQMIAQATGYLEAAVKLEPALYDAYVDLAYTKVRELRTGTPTSKKENFEAALTIYDHAIRDTVGLKSVRARLGSRGRLSLLYQALRAALGYYTAAQEPADRQAALDWAEKFVEHARGQFPESFVTYYLEGELAVARGNLLAAVQALNKAEEQSRGFSAFFNRLANERLALLYRQGSQDGLSADYTDRALAAYRDAGLEPPKILLINKGQVLNLLDRTQEALDLGRILLEQYPDDTQAVGIVTAALAKLGRNEEANQVLARFSQGTQSTESQMVQARFAAFEKDYGTAETVLRDVLEREPEHMEALRLVVRVLAAAERREEARELLRNLRQRTQREDLRRVLDGYDIALSVVDPEQRDQKVRELIESISDPVQQAREYYSYYSQREEFEKAAPYLDRLEEAYPEDAGLAAQQFALAVLRQQFDRAEQYTARLAHENADLANGATYRGRLALARGKPEEALREFRDADRQLSARAGLKVNMAQALLALPTPRYDEAATALREALKINPRNFTANKLLYAIHVQLGRRQDGVEYLRMAYRLNPNDAFIRSESEFLDEETDPAKGIARREEIRQSEPENVENLVRLGELYAKTNDSARASECFRAAGKAAPANDALARAAGDFYARVADFEPGVALLRAHIEAQSGLGKIRGQMFLGALYERVGAYAAARDCYVAADRLVDTVVEDPEERRATHVRTGFQLAEFYTRVQMVKEMIEVCRRVLNHIDPKDATMVQRARLQIIEGLLATRRYGDAEQEVEAYAREYPNEPRGLVARAQLLLSRNQREEARRVLSLVLQQEPGHSWALVTRGGINLDLGKTSEAREDFLRAKQSPDIDPGRLQSVRYQLATLYERTGQVELAEAELRDILAAQPQLESIALRLLQLFRNAGQPAKAQAVVGEFMARQPDNAFWPYQLGLLLMEREEYSNAVQHLKNAVELSKSADGRIVADYLHALVKANRATEAVRAFEGLDPQRVPAGVRVRGAEAYLALGQRAKALDHLGRAAIEASHADLSTLSYVVANIDQTLAGDEKVALFRAIVARPPADEYAAWRVRIALAATLLSAHQPADVPATIDPVIEQAPPASPERVRAMLLRAEAFAQQNELDQAVQFYEQILLENDSEPQALNNLAYLLVDTRNRPKEALQYVERLRQVGGQDANMLDTVGWVYYHNALYAEAEATFLDALRLDANALAPRYHLGHVYRKLNKESQAREAFQAVLERARAKQSEEYVRKAQEALGQAP